MLAPGSEPRSERWAALGYNALLLGATPVLGPILVLTGLLGGKYVKLLPQRLGWRLPRCPGPGAFWVHAVSAGEVLAARTLIAGLRRRTAAPVALSSTTATGVALASSSAVDLAFPSPCDYRGTLRRVFEALRPRALVLVEAELWPNWLREARRRRVPVALVNGRISDRSFPRYRRARVLFRPLFASLAAAGARTAQDAARLVELGARPDRVAVTGDLKYDAPVAAESQAEARRRLGLPATGFVLVAGSVHDGEMGAVLGAFRTLLAREPGAVLLLAPRKSWEPPAEAASFPLARRSRGEATRPGGILWLDTMGELAGAYGAGDLAFVGGSLVPAGGHNLLEPAAAGLAVLFGPSVETFAAPAAELERLGGGVRVRDGEDLGRAVRRLHQDGGLSRSRGAAAREVARGGTGSLERTLRLLEPLLAGDREGATEPV